MPNDVFTIIADETGDDNPFESVLNNTIKLIYKCSCSDVQLTRIFYRPFLCVQNHYEQEISVNDLMIDFGRYDAWEYDCPNPHSGEPINQNKIPRMISVFAKDKPFPINCLILLPSLSSGAVCGKSIAKLNILGTSLETTGSLLILYLVGDPFPLIHTPKLICDDELRYKKVYEKFAMSKLVRFDEIAPNGKMTSIHHTFVFMKSHDFECFVIDNDKVEKINTTENSVYDTHSGNVVYYRLKDERKETYPRFL